MRGGIAIVVGVASAGVTTVVRADSDTRLSQEMGIELRDLGDGWYGDRALPIAMRQTSPGAPVLDTTADAVALDMRATHSAARHVYAGLAAALGWARVGGEAASYYAGTLVVGAELDIGPLSARAEISAGARGVGTSSAADWLRPALEPRAGIDLWLCSDTALGVRIASDLVLDGDAMFALTLTVHTKAPGSR